MKKFTRLFLPALLALGMFATALPAHAVQGPVAVGVCQGTANVTPTDGAAGLGLPIVHTSHHATWDLATSCVAVSADGPETTVGLNASGVLVGYCGSSNGTGSGDIDGHSLDVSWISLGSQLHVNGNHAGPGFTVGKYVAEVNAQGGQDCIGEAADTFAVQIVGAFI